MAAIVAALAVIAAAAAAAASSAVAAAAADLLSHRHHHFAGQGIDRRCVPELDYLHGEASGGSGGTPRPSVEAQAGWANNGLGVRLGANWRSGTTVNSMTGDNLRFSPLAPSNLRLFDNLGDQPDLVVKHPWMRGTQLRFEVSNIFNARPNVRDATGAVPLSYTQFARAARPNGDDQLPQAVLAVAPSDHARAAAGDAIDCPAPVEPAAAAPSPAPANQTP